MASAATARCRRQASTWRVSARPAGWPPASGRGMRPEEIPPLRPDWRPPQRRPCRRCTPALGRVRRRRRGRSTAAPQKANRRLPATCWHGFRRRSAAWHHLSQTPATVVVGWVSRQGGLSAATGRRAAEPVGKPPLTHRCPWGQSATSVAQGRARVVCGDPCRGRDPGFSAGGRHARFDEWSAGSLVQGSSAGGVRGPPLPGATQGPVHRLRRRGGSDLSRRCRKLPAGRRVCGPADRPGRRPRSDPAGDRPRGLGNRRGADGSHRRRAPLPRAGQRLGPRPAGACDGGRSLAGDAGDRGRGYQWQDNDGLAGSRRTRRSGAPRGRAFRFRLPRARRRGATARRHFSATGARRRPGAVVGCGLHPCDRGGVEPDARRAGDRRHGLRYRRPHEPCRGAS